MAAEVEAVPTFGAELKDGFKPASAWVANGIAWLDDIQQFYRDRSLIEKEYSQKLTALANKYFEKKNKKMAQLSVGDTPAMTPGSLESASLTTWTTQLTTLESRAAEHDKYATNLVSQVAEPLKYYAGRFEELRKRHADYATKLEQERDSSYTNLRKTKGKYDTVCQEVETRRKKSESHYDKAKAQSAYQQQVLEMNNAKNSYLISIVVTNRLKERYYHEYVPEVMDSLQDLNEFRTTKLNTLWGVATTLEATMLKHSEGMMDHLATEIKRNSPHLDSMMYMRHNLGTFHEPPDKVFEPSPVWHDDDTMVVDDMATIYLRNLLSRSKASLGELRRDVDKKRREVDAARALKQRVRSGTEKKDEVEVIRHLFATQEDLHALDRLRLTAEVETATITSAVGDITLGAKNHNFKSQTFKIPTNCDLCGERIWGLSAKGFDCRDCGYTCHSKCEMKVPADCPGEKTKDERKKLKAERQTAANQLLKPGLSGSTSNVSEGTSLSRSNTMNSLSSRTSAQRSVSGTLPGTIDENTTPSRPSVSSIGGGKRNRVVAPPPAAYISDNVDEKRGKMVYGFEGTGDGELSVPEGREVILVEDDDGSGWIKVRHNNTDGLVPASYADFTPTTPTTPARPASISSSITKKKGPAVAPKRGAKKLTYVEALYEYIAQGAGEHSMTEGERFVLVKEDGGDGWVEVERAGIRGSVPGSYVKVV